MKKKAAPLATEMVQEEQIQVVQEESKGHRIANTIINVILVVAIALAAVCTYVSYVSTSGSGIPSLLGVQVFSIQTESMYPTLLPGDLIFDTAIKDTSELRKGDIITYWTVINGERVLNTHRIHEIYDGGGYLIFSTKGDNNTAADALTVHESEVVGQYKTKIGGLGKVFDYLQTSTGFLIVVVIPVFIFFLYHVVQFFRVLFEYQNVKNRIKYEQERGRTEDLIDAQRKHQMQAKELERAAIEAELREKLRAELMASMGKDAAAVVTSGEAAPAAPAAQAKPAKKKAAPKPAVEKKPEVVEESPVQEEKIELTASVEEETTEVDVTSDKKEAPAVQTAQASLEEPEVEETEFDDDDFDEDELYAGGSLDDLLFGGDTEDDEEPAQDEETV